MRAIIVVPACVLTASLFASSFPRTRTKSLVVHNETVLSGIPLDYNVEQLIGKLGQPDRVKTEEVSVAPGHGSRTYQWDRSNFRLKVAALSDGRIVEIDVRGEHPENELGATGKGLSIGSTREDAARIYMPFSTANAQFWRWNFSRPDCPLPRPNLEIDFDAAGRMNHMSLSNGTIFCY